MSTDLRISSALSTHHCFSFLVHCVLFCEFAFCCLCLFTVVFLQLSTLCNRDVASLLLNANTVSLLSSIVTTSRAFAFLSSYHATVLFFASPRFAEPLWVLSFHSANTVFSSAHHRVRRCLVFFLSFTQAFFFRLNGFSRLLCVSFSSLLLCCSSLSSRHFSRSLRSLFW